jgi:hypothetical protein
MDIVNDNKDILGEDYDYWMQAVGGVKKKAADEAGNPVDTGEYTIGEKAAERDKIAEEEKEAQEKKEKQEEIVRIENAKFPKFDINFNDFSFFDFGVSGADKLKDKKVISGLKDFYVTIGLPAEQVDTDILNVLNEINAYKKKYGVSNAGNIINNYYKRLENLRISKINELKGY